MAQGSSPMSSSLETQAEGTRLPSGQQYPILEGRCLSRGGGSRYLHSLFKALLESGMFSPLPTPHWPKCFTQPSTSSVGQRKGEGEETESIC